MHEMAFLTAEPGPDLKLDRRALKALCAHPEGGALRIIMLAMAENNPAAIRAAYEIAGADFDAISDQYPIASLARSVADAVMIGITGEPATFANVKRIIEGPAPERDVANERA